MRLIILHPEVAWRDCQSCQKFDYDDNGNLEIGRDGLPSERAKGCLAPCRYTHKGCPKGTPETPQSLTDANRQAYEHYRECRAVGQFPDDPIVRHHAALIRETEDECHRVLERRKLADMLGRIIG